MVSLQPTGVFSNLVESHINQPWMTQYVLVIWFQITININKAHHSVWAIKKTFQVTHYDPYGAPNCAFIGIHSIPIWVWKKQLKTFSLWFHSNISIFIQTLLQMIHDSYLMKAFNKDNRKKLIAFSVRHITHTQNHLLTKIQLQLLI